MTSFELVESFERFVSIVSRHDYLFKAIRELGEFAQRIADQLNAIIRVPPEQQGNQINNARAQLQSATNHLRTFDPSRIFVQLPAATEELESFLADVRAIPPMSTVTQLLSEFSKQYGLSLTSSFTPDSVLQVLNTAKQLDNLLSDISEIVAFVNQRLTEEEPLPENYSELLLVINPSKHAVTVLNKLSAVSELYDKLCELLEVSSQRFPLTIRRVEVGSLFLKLIGNSEVIRCLSNLLERVIQYLYRNYTVEGRIEGVPVNVEAIDSIIKLRDELEVRGIDTARIDGIIKESSITVAQNLNSLLVGEMNVNLNGKVYSVSEETRQRLPAPEERRLITGPDEPKVNEEK